MNKISFKPTRKAPTSYWQQLYEKAEALCKTEPTVKEIYDHLVSYRSENVTSKMPRIIFFRSSGKDSVAFVHGTDNGGAQLATISENYQEKEVIILEDKEFKLCRLRDHFNVFEEMLIYDLKAWIVGELKFEQVERITRNTAIEKMERRKQWHGQVTFDEEVENGMPVLVLRNVHYNSPYLKLVKKKEVPYAQD